jgi:glyoxylase-like metal-dependent hydrolase (beta-lactamase superfamily II)
VPEYLRIVDEEGYQLTHVLDTHIHGDHVSGSRMLAEKTGAKLYMHESAPVQFPFQPLRDGELFQIGNPKVKVFHTPGHTPESMSLLFDKRLITTGDTLFVGDVGRTDLYQGATPEALYDSVQRLMALDDYLGVFPSHYGNSMCGKGLSPVTSTTIGFERRANYAVKAASREDFLRVVTEAVPPPPAEYVRVKRINAGLEEP